MKKTILLLASLTMFYIVSAQNTGISKNDMDIIKKYYDINDASTRALTNALSNNDLKKITLNRQNLGNIDHHFKYKVDVHGITNQKSSGRCWMFTSLNVIRPFIIDKYNLSCFEFSESYLYFWDIFEKANLYLETQIKYSDRPMDDKYVVWLFKNPINDGGVWTSFTNLVEKYGLMPKEVFPESNTSENTRQMTATINRKLREDGLQIRHLSKLKYSKEQLKEQKLKMLGEIYRILAMNLGEPPNEFSYRFVDKDGNIGNYKNYTPVSFRDEVLSEINLSNYVMLMNDPSRDYYKLYEVEYDRNVTEGRNWFYINLPVDSIKKYALKSIKNNKAMYASCDVGKQLNNNLGYSDIDNYDIEALYGITFGMNKADRIRTFDSGSTHGMALIAVDTDKQDTPLKWQFENSWGTSSGHNGYLTFTDRWFDEYMFRVVVSKEFVNNNTLKILEQKPVILPPWDPLFQPDN